MGLRDHPRTPLRPLPGPAPRGGAAAQALGFDYGRLVGARDRLHQRLHKLSPEVATLNAGGGAFSALSLLGNDPGIVSWMTFRARLTAGLPPPRTRPGGGPHPGQREAGQAGRGAPHARLLRPLWLRLPATAPLFDLILPKLYLWHRGFDGMYGTVARYVETLMEWNPGLWEPEAFLAVRALLGISLPSPEPDARPGQTITALRELEARLPRRLLPRRDDR